MLTRSLIKQCPALQRSLSSVLTRKFSNKDETDKTYSDKNKENSSFGFQDVDPSQRQSLVNQVFSNVASSYDVMNDFMSMGVHRLWKEYFVNEIGMLRPKRVYKDGQIVQRDKCRVIDMAGGTGDISFKIIDKQKAFMRNVGESLEVNVMDINGEMLKVGQERAITRGYDLSMMNFIEANAEDLSQFEDNSIDLYTIAFGIRNVSNIPKALEEANRVLKKGGRFMCLEFSKVQNPVLREVYNQYSFNAIPFMGEVVANDRASYQYLVESIEKFHSQEQFKVLMQEAGFSHVSFQNLTNGVVAVHSGYKL